ncbi:MAG: hypothetical protein HGA47_00820 [Zoogloea sp.]|nr:hypothetical protein [Zoogloea sp.]
MIRKLQSLRPFLAVLALVVAGCGFQLRGQQALPFESIYLGMNPYSDLAATIKRNIRAGSTTAIAETAGEAQARLEVMSEGREKIVRALNAQGRVREYELRQRFGFRVVDKKGREIIAPNEIVVHRDLAFDDSQLLAKEQEEVLLYRDMQGDLVQQLMRRLAAAKLPAD